MFPASVNSTPLEVLLNKVMHFAALHDIALPLYDVGKIGLLLFEQATQREGNKEQRQCESFQCKQEPEQTAGGEDIHQNTADQVAQHGCN